MKALIPLLLLIAGCNLQEPPNRTVGVYMLLDTSGTYTQEIDKARQVINFTLTRLQPGDSFAIARVDTASFIAKLNGQNRSLNSANTI